jgi:hypothetical protein
MGAKYEEEAVLKSLELSFEVERPFSAVQLLNDRA